MLRTIKTIGGVLATVGFLFVGIQWVEAQTSIPTISPWTYFGGRTTNIRPVASTTKVLIGSNSTTTKSFLETPNIAITGLTAALSICKGSDGIATTTGCSGGGSSSGGLSTTSALSLFIGTYPVLLSTTTISATYSLAFSTTTANSWSALNTFAAASTTNLTASNFWIISQSDGCGTFTGGKLTSTGVACGSGGGADLFTHPSTNVSATTSGLIISASSTIGNATQTGGLTVSGGSTTTLNAYFQSPVGINGVSNRGLFGGNGILTVNGDASNGAVFEFFRPITSGSSNIFTLTFGDTTNSVLGQINGRTDTSGGTGRMSFLTSNGSANVERLRIDSQGQVMVGTTSAFSAFTIASSSGAQLSLVDGSPTSNAWTMRSIANSFFIATSTNATSATSSIAALSINPNGLVTTNFASTTNFYGAGLTVCQSGNVLTYNGTGNFGCAADATGAGAAWPFTTSSWNGQVAAGTSTTYRNTGTIVASSTFFTTASSTISNGVRYADNYRGATIDAKINNAYADCAAGGVCEIHLNGNYTFSSPLNFNTADKPAKLVCDGGNATKLTYSGSASSTNWNSGLADYGAWGIYGCNLYGQQLGTPDGTVGISLGGSNGARDFVMESTHIVGFGTGVQTEQNTIMPHFKNSLLEYNYRDWDFERANNSGEGFTFDGVTTADCNTGGINKCLYADVNALTDAIWTGGSFDGAQAYFEDGNSNIVFNGTHWENTAQMRAGSYTGLVTATGGFSSFALNSVEFMNGATTTAKSPVQWILNGANMTMNGVVANQSGGVSVTSLINNFGGNGYVSSVGFKNITGTAAGVSIFATSSARFFVDNQNNFTGIATSTNLNGNVLNVNGGMGLNGSFRIYKTTDVSTFTTINFDAATNKVFISWPLGLDSGGLTVGASYQGLQPPTGGAIIQGLVGVATSSPGSAFSIGTTAGINFSEATSSFSSTGGINLKSGCFAIAGVCVGTLTMVDSFTHPFSGYSATTSVFMIGTSTPGFGQLTLGSSTAPQLVLSDNIASDSNYYMRTTGGSFYLGTSTPSATSSSPASVVMYVNPTGSIEFGSSTPIVVNGDGSTNFVNFIYGAGMDGHVLFRNFSPGKAMSFVVQSAADYDHIDLNTGDASWLMGMTNGNSVWSLFENSGVVNGRYAPIIQVAQGATSTALILDANSHFSFGGTTNAAASKLSSCGTSPSFSGVSNDTSGAITIGTGIVNACTFTFIATFGNAGHCFLDIDSASATSTVVHANVSATTMIIRASASNIGGAKIHYFCPAAASASI